MPDPLAAVRRASQRLAQDAAVRDAAIRTAYANGKTLREIAAAAGLTFPRIHQIVKKEKP